MVNDSQATGAAPGSITLVVRRSIRTTPERLFDAWVDPEQLKRWWGPAGVTCVEAEVDLRVGGRYRLANQFADGRVLWITGEFEVIERPTRLVYTWQLGSAESAAERVTVNFAARGTDTEVIVTHEHIPNRSMRDGHERGWFGCLDGLAHLLGDTRT